MFYIVSTFYLFILVCDDLALVGSPLVCAKECLRNDKKKKKDQAEAGAKVGAAAVADLAQVRGQVVLGNSLVVEDSAPKLGGPGSIPAKGHSGA